MSAALGPPAPDPGVPPEICARCADNIPPRELRTCCGRPFCAACYAAHVEDDCEVTPRE